MIKSINGLRAAFALIIFLDHSYLNGKSIFLEGGNLSVTFFFIISGFLLAYSYGERIVSGEVTSDKFFLKRIAKVYPLHVIGFVLSLPLIIAPKIYCNTLSLNDLYWGGQNLMLLHSWVPNNEVFLSYNAVSWFLSDIAFFYFLFPLLAIALLKRTTPQRVIISFLVLLFVEAFLILPMPSEYAQSLVYINPMFRLVDFVLGILLFQVFKLLSSKPALYRSGIIANMLEVVSVVLIVIVSVLVHDKGKLFYYSILFWIPISLMILSFVYNEKTGQKGFIGRFMSTPLLQKLGEISFSFYLLHWLVIHYLTKIGEETGYYGEGLPLVLVSLILSLLVAYCYNRFMEKKLVNKLENRILR